MKRSKRYKAIAEKIEAGKTYTLAEAIALLKDSPVKFDSGMELHMNLGIDASKSEQLVRSTVVLPNGTGKTKRVAAFVSEAKEAEAKEAGADIIGTQAVIDEIKKSGKCDFDVAVATPDMMRSLGPVAKTLGQQGLMPNPKTETVGDDVAKMVKELKGGKVAYRSDDSGNVHFLVGRVSFDEAKLVENMNVIIESVKKARPAEAKGQYILKATLSASMAPGIPVSVE